MNKILNMLMQIYNCLNKDDKRYIKLAIVYCDILKEQLIKIKNENNEKTTC